MNGKEFLLEIAGNLVKKALEEGFDEVAVQVRRKKEVMVKVANSEPSVIQNWTVANVGIYLAKEGRIMIVEQSPAKLEDTEKVFGELKETAKLSPPSPFYAPLPEPQSIEPLEGLVDKRILNTMNDPSDLTEMIINTAFEEDIDYVAGMIDFVYSEKALATSKDVNLYEDATYLEAYLRAFAGKGSGQWAYGSRMLKEGRLRKMALEAARLASRAKHPEPGEPGVYDVILSPMVAGNLLNLVAGMSSAFSVLMGTSIFMNKKPGDKVASSIFTLIDDPRKPESAGSTAFDSEGVPTYTKPIIKEGVLKTFLHNSKTAAKMGAKSTGNAGWLWPHPWSLRIPPGEYTLDELIREVERGILVTNNWYTRLQNYVEGVFSTITRDALFFIENGEIVRPIYKLRIADRLPTLLQNIAALGREVYDIKWWEVGIPTRTPYILVKNLHTSTHTA